MKKLCIIFISILFLVSSCATKSSLETNNQDINILLSENIDNIENIEQNKQLLSDTYIETNDKAYFFKELYYLEKENAFDIYRLENYLNILVNIRKQNIDSEFQKQINSFVSKEISKASFYELEFYKALSLANIISLANCDMENYSDYFIEYLHKYYDKEEGLFYKSKDSSYKLKVADTINGLKILEKVGYIPEEFKQPMSHTLSDLLNEKDYFTMNEFDIEGNLFDIGITALEATVVYNRLVTENPIHIPVSKEWFTYWAGKMQELSLKEENMLSTNAVIFSLMEINKHYSIDLDFSLYAQYLKSIDLIEILRMDIKSFYFCLYIMLDNGYDYDVALDKKIDDYRIFIYHTTPDIAIKEQYFAYQISKELEFDINEELFIQTISTRISEDNNLEENYYFLRLLFEMNHLEKIKTYRTIYEKQLDTIYENMRQKKITAKEIFYSIYIAKIYEMPLPNIAFSELAKSLYEQENIDENLYYYILTQKILNKKIDAQWLKEEIDTYFKGEKGFAILKENKNSENILSTYRMLKLLMISNSTETISNYNTISLDLYEGSFGGYFMMFFDEIEREIENYEHNLRYESWYYGMAILNMIL